MIYLWTGETDSVEGRHCLFLCREQPAGGANGGLTEKSKMRNAKNHCKN